MPERELPPAVSGVPPAANLAPAEVDRVVHEPARLMILAHLYVVEAADFTFLLRQTGLTWGNLSAHIVKLEQAGYVTVQKQFVGKKPNSMLHLTDRGRAAFRSYRQNMRQLMSDLPD